MSGFSIKLEWENERWGERHVLGDLRGSDQECVSSDADSIKIGFAQYVNPMREQTLQQHIASTLSYFHISLEKTYHPTHVFLVRSTRRPPYMDFPIEQRDGSESTSKIDSVQF